MDGTGIDWENVDPEVTDFIFYQAEKQLEAQLQCGIASDARAITAASILAGLGGAILAGVIALWAADQIKVVVPAGLVLGLMLMDAAYWCFRAARPIDFYAPGNQPEEWYGCLDTPLSVSKGGEIENYQEEIRDNDAALRQAADRLVSGMRLALGSAPVAAAICLITYLFSR